MALHAFEFRPARPDTDAAAGRPARAARPRVRRARRVETRDRGARTQRFVTSIRSRSSGAASSAGARESMVPPARYPSRRAVRDRSAAACGPGAARRSRRERDRVARTVPAGDRRSRRGDRHGPQGLSRAPGVATAAHMMGPLTLYLAGRSTEALPLAGEAADAARSSRDTTFILYALSHLGLNLTATGRYAEAMTCSAKPAASAGRTAPFRCSPAPPPWRRDCI